MYFLPRIHDAPAAIRHMTIAAEKAICSPSMNGPEINSGKKLLPVIVLACSGVRVSRTSAGTSFSIGLYPRKAAKRLPTGGASAIFSAVAAGTPLASRPDAIDVGSVDDNPTTISEKKRPMESTIPVFWNVDR